MDREEAHAALDEVGSAMRERHSGGTQADRLAQLDSHLSTAHMVVDHLFDHAENVDGA